MEAWDSAQPVEPWHRQVEKDDVGFDLSGFFDRLDPISRFCYHEDPIVGDKGLPK